MPYTIYTTGVAYRRDRIEDADAEAQGYDLLWNPDYAGQIAYYDSYRDAIGMALIRNGDMDPNTGDAAAITAAKDAILEIVNDLDGGDPDQRHVREASRGRVHRVAGMVRRHRGREVVPAEGHELGRPRLLVPRRRAGADRQRHAS